MRTIKFRAWDGLRMTTSGIQYNNTTGELEVPKISSFSNVDISGQWHVMQFTGLTDSKGVEIYEGDVVEHNGRRFEIHFTEKTGYIAVQIDKPTNFRDAAWIAGVRKYITIIGNIHEQNQ